MIPMNDEFDDAAPGWDAIDAHLARLYRGAEPQHLGYEDVSGNLLGCSAYEANQHWHYVTYGLSELYVPREGDDPEWSGWGFELTFRVIRFRGTQAPGWPFTMLNELARHINERDALVEPGHRFDMRGPITGFPHLPDAPPTGLTVFAVAQDPQLGVIRTPNGKVEFLQVVGVTDKEKQRMLATSTAEVIAELATMDSLLITDPARA